jgi:hypothetical protein
VAEATAEEAPNPAGASEPGSDAVTAEDLDRVVAGMDVTIDKVTTTVGDGDSTVSPGVLGAIVGSVLDALRRRF